MNSKFLITAMIVIFLNFSYTPLWASDFDTVDISDHSQSMHLASTISPGTAMINPGLAFSERPPFDYVGMGIFISLGLLAYGALIMIPSVPYMLRGQDDKVWPFFWESNRWMLASLIGGVTSSAVLFFWGNVPIVYALILPVIVFFVRLGMAIVDEPDSVKEETPAEDKDAPPVKDGFVLKQLQYQS